ncbi:bacterioopsin transcriptional activator [Halalkalicoccus paucihalophilus]|uniref:Bacterioopsin transcriptional activator n=1 Tax=Halalkalicoccus paucihalophilus TaxID=1008153 RepID=A0A151AG82_9EURY|nr:GAF domain-containing protein [Halalkalicoccus paucihalophilus]KYH26407.1 bacterioopsin transcriptional activator [Halalkalicoccus paucihalophilus]
MNASVPSPSTVLEEVDRLAPPGTPLTTPEVADGFDCTDRTIYNRLDTLVDTDVLETKKVGARGRVWWRPPDDRGFASAVEPAPAASVTDSGDSDGTDDRADGREAELAAELDATKRLQAISTRLIQKDDIDTLYDEILEAVVTVMDADFARLQLRDPDRGDLELLAHRGFDETTALWDRVGPESNGPCSVALETGRRVVVSDVETCGFMAGTEDRTTLLETGIRAVQSTPLVSRCGDVVGMLSTHWETPHEPSERDLRSLDVLARQATDLIGHRQAKEALRRNRELLAGEKRVLETLARGASLDDVLRTLVGVIEGYTDGMQGSVLVIEPGEERFGTVIGPNLPPSYVAALDGASISPPYMGPCGKAAHVGDAVVCEDIAPDTRWASEWRDLALSNDLHGCYSTPIVGADGEVLGSFGLYSTRSGDVVPDPDVREVVSDIAGVAIERKRTEEALQKSEERYRELFESMTEGFCVLEKVDTAPEDPVDFRYVEANPAFAEQSGLEDVVGKTRRDVISDEASDWAEVYDTVVRTGEPIQFERELASQGRILNLHAFPVGDGTKRRVGVVFRDVTERKRREERERFRTKLIDTLQPISDPIEIQSEAARVLGEHLDVDRALYNEVLADETTGVVHTDYHSEGLSSVVGTHRFDDSGEHVSEAFRSGETQVITDYATVPGLSDEERAAYRELDLHSYVGVPLVKDGRLTAFFAVNQATPREWTETEIEMIEETAERTWHAAERAHAEQALKRANEGLERLTTVSRELMDASPRTINRAAELTRTVLDVEYTALWRYDGTTGEFSRHAHHTPSGTDPDSVRLPEGLSKRVWQAFIDDDLAVENDLSTPEDEGEHESEGECASGTPLRSRMLIPLGGHGVVCVGSTRAGAFDEQTVDLATTLGATLETAWDRASGERRLARQNEELARLDRLNGLIREIDSALVEADSRAAIDRAVCDRLAASDHYEFVWIGERDPVAETITPREWAGVDGGYIDELAIPIDATTTGRDPVAATVRTRDLQVVSDIATETRFTPEREATLERGARSCISVPLIYKDSLYGVLAVYADHPQPDERDHAVLAELGRTIGHAINAVETRETRHTNRVVELTLTCRGRITPLCRLAHRVGCDVRFEGLAHRSDGEPDVFFTASDVPSAELLAASEQVSAITELLCLADRDEEALFRARVSEPTLASRIVEQDAVVRTLTIEGGVATAVVDVPHTATVREFVDRLRHGGPDPELLARRTRDRPLKTRSTFRTICAERLTAKQLAALETAYFSGFFESPRTQTGREVAASLDVSQPTFTTQLRAAQRGICDLLFAAGGTTVDS